MTQNSELIYWDGALRWRKTGLPFVEAVATPLYRYPINSGGYGKCDHCGLPERSKHHCDLWGCPELNGSHAR